MADLLTDEDRAEISSAIEDVIDTFFRKTVKLVTYRQPKLSAFNEKREDKNEECITELLGLWIPDNTDDDAEADRRSEGTLDDSEGVVYFGYQDLKNATPSLIKENSLQVDIVPNTDKLRIDGEDRDIIGINLVGPKLQEFFLLKVHYSNPITSQKPTED